jgi:hypothetical protein
VRSGGGEVYAGQHTAPRTSRPEAVLQRVSGQANCQCLLAGDQVKLAVEDPFQSVSVCSRRWGHDSMMMSGSDKIGVPVTM